MTVRLTSCKLTGNGVHRWMLIDRVDDFTVGDPVRPRVMYLFACQFCLGTTARWRESLEIIAEVAEEVGIGA
jgi:hypothetical protein